MRKEEKSAVLKTLFFILIFVIILPGELLIWGKTLDARLAGSYLSKRVELSICFDLPQELLLVLGAAAVCFMLRGFWGMFRKNHECDILIFGGFPVYMLSLFLYFRLPCTLVFGIPLILLTEIAVWFACRPENRPAFLLPDERTVPATPAQRAAAFFQLVPILLAASLIFQEGYLMWLTFSWTPLMVILPLAGLLLPKAGQIREYVGGALYALILCSAIYLTGQFFAVGVLMTDFGIVVAYVFLELMIAVMFRPLLPAVRNSSLLILGASSVLTYWIMPSVCSPWIITLSMYVLYLLIDNRKVIRKKLLSRAHFRRSEVHVLSWVEYAAQAWGFGTLLAVYLAGPDFIHPILIGLGVLFVGRLIRSRILSISGAEHIILTHFPFAIEISLLILSAFLTCHSREAVMILLSAYAAASCLMLMVWSIGGLIGKYTEERPSLQLFHIFSYAGMSFLLVLLFFIQAPASIMLGCFCILSGIIRIGGASYRKPRENFSLTAGWLMIVIGQFFFVSTSEVLLPSPKWSSGCVPCAFVACAVLYVCRLYDFRIRERRINT